MTRIHAHKTRSFVMSHLHPKLTCLLITSPPQIFTLANLSPCQSRIMMLLGNNYGLKLELGCNPAGNVGWRPLLRSGDVRTGIVDFARIVATCRMGNRRYSST